MYSHSVGASAFWALAWRSGFGNGCLGGYLGGGHSLCEQFCPGHNSSPRKSKWIGLNHAFAESLSVVCQETARAAQKVWLITTSASTKGPRACAEYLFGACSVNSKTMFRPHPTQGSGKMLPEQMPWW